MKILLAIDGSDFSKAAVEQFKGIPLPSDTEVCILNVYENPIISGPNPLAMGGTSSNYFQEAISNAQKSAEDIVSSASKLLKDINSTISVTTSVVSGLPKIAILEKAETFGADLIVVGSQGHGAFSHFLLGSVSQSIASHANCSVMIAREKMKSEFTVSED